MRAIIFPGQGAQFKGMGKDLFGAYPDLIQRASDILGYSIQKLCLEDPDNKLKQTQYTQPALFIVNALAYYKMRDADPKNFKADYFAGHSLGEYNALLAAEAFDFETGVRLVKKRGELMAAANGGKMAAVIGASAADVSGLLKENGLESIDLANFNTPTQLVLAGPAAAIDTAEKMFSAKGIRCVILNVSAAFHSRCMKEAARIFASYVQGFALGQLKAPVIANATARPYQNDRIGELLATQIASPVQWTDSVRYLMGRGEIDFTEIGSSILSKMVQEIRRTEKPIYGEDPKAASLPRTSIAGELPAAPAKAPVHPPVPDSAEAKAQRDMAAILGSKTFCKRFGLKYAYVAGSMFHGISSADLVVRMGNAGLMAIYGAYGKTLKDVEEAIDSIRSRLDGRGSYGSSLVANYDDPEAEVALVDLYLKKNVCIIEASSYVQMTVPLVLFRLKGLRKDGNGAVSYRNKILAKVSGPAAAEAFMSPAPRSIIKELLKQGLISEEQAELAKAVPMSADLCIEADSGWRSNAGNPFALLPAMLELRKRITKQYAYEEAICLGLSGGIGSPQAAAAAFTMGADFILTGSVNQCTAEAKMSEEVKDILQDINVGDTEYAQAGQRFEIDGKFQVLKKGTLFSARANKLTSLYAHYNSWDEIPEKTRKHLQAAYFKKDFSEVWSEISALLERESRRHEILKAEANPKYKLALLFRWYFDYSMKLAFAGASEDKTNYQVHTGPALGAFNQFVKGSRLEQWRERHVDEVAIEILSGAAGYFASGNKAFGAIGFSQAA